MTATTQRPPALTLSGARGPLDLRGRTITTFILFEVAQELTRTEESGTVTFLTDDDEAVDADIHAWCRATGHELTHSDARNGQRSYEIVKGKPRQRSGRLAMIISNPGLEELLSPLGFALAAALEDLDVHLYVQGPAVKLLRRGYREKLPGLKRPFSRFARAGLTKAGHLPAQQKLHQLRELGGHIYVCGPSMHHFRVKKQDLIFDNLPIVEYATFMSVMKDADIHLFLQ
jgi:predicted peroxiredoxin/TusA-related sulfurtransferase